MSNRRILHDRLNKWIGARRDQLGEQWKELELSWAGNNIIDQYIRQSAYFYSSIEDFEGWLDDYFADTIKQMMPTANA